MDIIFDWRLTIFWVVHYGLLLTILIAVEYNLIHKKIKRKLNEIEKAISEIGKPDEKSEYAVSRGDTTHASVESGEL